MFDLTELNYEMFKLFPEFSRIRFNASSNATLESSFSSPKY